jgi:hypothetical protein
MNGGRGRQIAQDQTKWVIGSDFVIAVGDDEQYGNSTNSPPKESQ